MVVDDAPVPRGGDVSEGAPFQEEGGRAELNKPAGQALPGGWERVLWFSPCPALRLPSSYSLPPPSPSRVPEMSRLTRGEQQTPPGASSSSHLPARGSPGSLACIHASRPRSLSACPQLSTASSASSRP